MDLFASTSSLWTEDIDPGVLQLFEAGFDGVELSSSSWDPEIIQKIGQWRQIGLLSIHNYFPRPQKEFVFNLASKNNAILSQSLNHAKTTVEIAHAHDMTWVSFHSGFLIDPQPEELGGVIHAREKNNRAESLESFTRHAKAIAEFAASKGVRVLWENNVLSAANFNTFNSNPFLLVGPDEILAFDTHMPGNSGILLDVAHLSVSCQAMGIDRESALRKLGPIVRGLHLSEDNGRIDDGGLVKKDSWFWKHLPREFEYCVVESRFSRIDDARNQQSVVRERFADFGEEATQKLRRE